MIKGNEMTNGVDAKELRQLYGASPTARTLLDYLALRKKSSAKTDIDRLEAVLRQDGRSIARREIIATLKKLEDLQCGRFVVGRRGQPSRFEWAVQMSDLGSAGRGEGAAVRAYDAEQTESDEAELTKASGDMLQHTYMLRADVATVLSLPRDLTVKEAVRLADFIRTLPFDSMHG